MAEADTAVKGAGSLGKSLGKNIGPLPAGIWIVVIAGGLGVAYFINRSGNAPSGDSAGDFGSATSGTGTGAVSTWAANQPPGSPSTSPIANNIQWEQAASSYLLSLGADPALVDSAMRKYLFDQPLTPSEQAVINAAIRQFGLPPEPLPPPVTPPGGNNGGNNSGNNGGNNGGTTAPPPTIYAQPIGNGQVRVDWNYTGTDVTGWTISRNGTDTNGTGGWSTDKSASDRTHTFNSLRAGDIYTFTLVGHTAHGDLSAVSDDSPVTGGITNTANDASSSGSGSGQINTTPPPPAPIMPDPVPPTPAPAPPAPRTYTVVKGDTLWGISKKFYGNGAFWSRIYNANRDLISNPNLIYPGQTFIIP